MKNENNSPACEHIVINIKKKIMLERKKARWNDICRDCMSLALYCILFSKVTNILHNNVCWDVFLQFKDGSQIQEICQI